uniref:DUF5131 family protein n=1 Tax=viral metagenome TaxID=1070528 RepID=A0A6H1ZTB9_9ZZZZ
MPLNKSKGNMYEWTTHTFNTCKGICPHMCHYCYCKAWGPQKPIRFDEKELKTDLGKFNTIFIGSSCDLFADEIPGEWIQKTIDHCKKFPLNSYLFQSKNPKRMFELRSIFPSGSLFGTTIETNRQYDQMGRAPLIVYRVKYMGLLGVTRKTMVTLEPIMDFDIKELVSMIEHIRPTWVNIGADSKGHGLPEPSADKILALIDELKKFTEIKQKKNLSRLLNGK